METHFFWAFLMIALVAGFALGAIYVDSPITGESVNIVTNGSAKDAYGNLTTFTKNITCMDSDKGTDLEVMGKCIDFNGIHYDESYADTTLNKILLREWYCTKNNYCGWTAYDCEALGYEGAYNGVCVMNLKDAAQSSNFLFSDGSQLPHCETIYDFYLSDKNNIFHVEKCEKAIYIGTDKKYEVIFHAAYVDPIRKKVVAHVQYTESYLDGAIYNEQDLIISPEDCGFVIEVLKVVAEPGDRAILMMPEGGYWSEGVYTHPIPMPILAQTMAAAA